MRSSLPASTHMARASCSATQAPVMLAVRVPPSAWITSQSTVTVYSPSAFMLTTVRRLRPIKRSISMERPLRLACSRLQRLPVDAGSIAYSAVTQPALAPLRQPGTPSSMVAAHSTRVSPNSARHEPWACFMTPRVSLTGRSSFAARPLARLTCIYSMELSFRQKMWRRLRRHCVPNRVRRYRHARCF